jgi:long-subunit acyl-CoA synthetase (AMP-forming)
MKTIAVTDVQNNTAFFSNLLEAIAVVDQYKKQTVAIIYPVQKNHIVQKLAGKYKNRVSSPTTDIETIKETAMKIAMAEKQGYTD